MVDRQTLMRAMGNDVISDDETAGYNAALILCDCSTVKRAAMFAAQIGHESVGLRYYSEIWGPTSDQISYDPSTGSRVSRDLGNTEPGDGYRFRGRGPLQVTGRLNYTRLSQWAHGRGAVPSPTFFVDNPDALASARYGFMGAAWYWSTQRPMNALADASTRDDITAATRAINGGTNGIGDRLTRWRRCLDIGTALLPTDEDPLMGADIGKLNAAANQLDGQAAESPGPAYAPPAWLRRFLPPSYRDKDEKTGRFLGAWVRDQITAIANEVVTGTFNLTDPIDFGGDLGKIAPKDVPPDVRVNFVTLLRIVGARQAVAQGLIK